VSALLEARAAVLAAIEAGGARTATGPKLAAPCVHVEPGDPWYEPVSLGAGNRGRVSRWRLTAVAGRADSDAAFEALGTLIDQVDTGLRTLGGTQLPTWAKPTDYALEGVPYAASVATIQVRQ